IHWWSQLAAPVGLLIALFGFVVYRFRETRALTMAQCFGVRYSRRLRVFLGMLAFIAGVVNYGIFPIVGARVFVDFGVLSASPALTASRCDEPHHARRRRSFMDMPACIARIVIDGILPIVGARFFVHLCSLPARLALGAITLPTMPVLMALFLAIALYFVLSG